MPIPILSFADALELFLNILEFVAIIGSVFTFFILMINKFSKALKLILYPCGLTFATRVRALIICRKSERKKRAFIEFALLKTRGETTLGKDWKTIINEFKSFYREQEDLVYTVHNCTALINNSFSNAAERYFEVFSKEKVKKTFGITDERIPWVVRIRIEEAYVTPTCLLTGLLSKYEENWAEFIKRYISTAFITESDEDLSGAILSSELYFTFAWLLWGPSYELNYKQYWAGLCQISYGDESNSIPAVASHSNNVVAKLSDRLKENEMRRYGALLDTTLSIYSQKPYYKAIRETVNPENAYFYDKAENGDLSFAVQIDDFIPQEGYKAQKYYCTAYVWVMFELIEEDSSEFHPEKCVAFFEHANLTDKHTYKFLTETLIGKAIAHFETIFSDPTLAGRSYRYVCSMNTIIEERLMARIAERSQGSDDMARAFSQRLVMRQQYTPATVFSAFDEFFTPSNTLKYEEVQLSNKESIVRLASFYTEVYMDCFPDEDERESFNNLLFYLKQAENQKAYKYHIILAMDENDKIVGGTIFDYFPKTNAGVIEFLAVKGDQQSSGIGSLIYRHVQTILTADAHKLRNEPLSHIFCEIDAPEYSKASIKKYLHFWNKHGFKHIDMEYIQPALSHTQEPVSGLWLTVSSMKGNPKNISSEYVMDVIRDYMKYSMQIDVPQENPSFVKMRDNLPKDDVLLLPIL